MTLTCIPKDLSQLKYESSITYDSKVTAIFFFFLTNTQDKNHKAPSVDTRELKKKKNVKFKSCPTETFKYL